MIKLTDFWAPWCVDPETPVLTESGYLKASQIKVGQKLVVVDPKTYKQITRRVQKVRIFNNTPSKKIVLETGRELVGDANHLVLTQKGFKKMEEIEDGEAILVNPTKNSLVFHSNNNDIILETSGNEYSDKVLRQLGLLPLKDNDFRLPILARLLGFIVTDGYLYEDLRHNIYETHFYVGTENDAVNVKTDLQLLGFDKLEIKKQVNNRQIGERKFVMNTLRCRTFSKAVFFLFKVLGSPQGRKKNQPYFIPDWIMNSSLEIKKEFLRGWLGGDGCKITYHIKQGGKSSHDAGFNVNAIEFHKEKDLEREGILYAKQLGLLFEELGVKVREISSSEDEDGVIISIRLATDYQSLLKLADIGYAYAATKNANTPFVGEFLRYRLLERNNYVNAKQVVLQQLSLGVGRNQIAEDLQIPIGTVTSWCYTNRTTEVVHTPKTGESLFTEWLEQRQQGILLWEKVISIADVENRDVVGITVGNPHTIVTNGIVSHNCGPCRAMGPVIEELEKEFEGKVEFIKINVDEDPQTASQYGVMGIPTFVIEKEGKEVGRKVGMTSKADLIALINS